MWKIAVQNKIESLTGVRFIAAFIVLIGHFVGSTKFPTLHNMSAISVQLFFVLSGFVMYISYSEKLHTIHFGKFLFLRIARLYPAFILTVICATVFIALIFPSTEILKHFLIDITMTQSWWGSISLAFSPIDGPIWSVSTEFLFYIIFFIVFRNVSLKINMLMFIVYFTAWICILRHYSISLDYYPFMWLYYVNPYYRFCDFWIGCFFAIIYKRNYIGINLFLKTKKMLITVIEVILFILLFGSQYFFPFDKCWWVLNIISVICGVLVLLLTFNYGLLSKLFSTRVFVLLGDASYSLYLIHMPIFSALKMLFHKYYFNSLTQKILLIFTPIILSIIIYKFYESPINKVIKNKILKVYG